MIDRSGASLLYTAAIVAGIATFGLWNVAVFFASCTLLAIGILLTNHE